MAFQQVPNTAQVTIAMNMNNSRMVMTHYGLRVGGYDSGNLQDLADDIDTWVGTSLMPQLSNQLTYTDTEVRGLNFENDLVALAIASAGVGGIASNPTPNQVAFCLKRLSGLTGRSARGRVYVPGIPTTLLSANESLVQTTFANTLVTVHNLLAITFANAGWQQVIVSRYTNGVKRAVGVTYPVSEWAYTSTVVSTQRGRLPDPSA